MEKYLISLLEEKDYEQYRQFVKENEDALYEHSLEVKELVEKHFKFKSVYLIAKEREKIVGALPLFEATSFIEGKRMVSIPFFPFGGVVGKDVECKKRLLEKAKELSSTAGFLEIRQKKELEQELAEGMVRQSLITDFLLPFKTTEEETFKSLDKRVRYDIKKAQKNNLKVKLDKEEKLLNDFYKIYLNTKKKRGVPAWPYGLFKEALETCNCLVGVTYLKEKPIASAFFFLHRKEIEYGFAGADYKYAHLCPYYVLLWEVIKFGIQKGYKVLDFGGTTKELNEGNLYAFKERWCKEKREIPYYFYAQKEKNIPSLEKSFSLYKFYGKAWSLLPKGVIRIISPLVIRQFK
ncbi:MAG: GNAT family N-acetyltransferase [Nanoarchaeota archaeon]